MNKLANLIDENKEVLAVIESWDNGTLSYACLIEICC
jgi:hypothetical protein